MRENKIDMELKKITGSMIIGVQGRGGKGEWQWEVRRGIMGLKWLGGEG